MDLNDFYYFVHVVDRGGITPASRSLSIPKSTISHRMQTLETALGAHLINRNSRQFSVTDIGLDFYKHAALMLEQAQAAEAVVRQRLVEPNGLIRFTAAVAVAQFATSKVLPQFLDRFPKVDVLQHTSDQMVDIVAENFDLAIRAHSEALPNSNLVQRTLGSAPWRLFAGRSYIEKYGMPTRPIDLADHRALFMMRLGQSPLWRLRSSEGEEHTIHLKPRLTSEDMVGLKATTQMGLGIVALPAFICREQVASGELQAVLPEWSAGESTLTALMPVRHGLLPSVRVFMDFLVSEMPKVLKV